MRTISPYFVYILQSDVNTTTVTTIFTTTNIFLLNSSSRKIISSSDDYIINDWIHVKHRTVMQKQDGIRVKDMPECKCIQIFYGWYLHEGSVFIWGLDICLPLSSRQLRNKDLTQACGLSLSSFSQPLLFKQEDNCLKSKTTKTTKLA